MIGRESRSVTWATYLTVLFNTMLRSISALLAFSSTTMCFKTLASMAECHASRFARSAQVSQGMLIEQAHKQQKYVLGKTEQRAFGALVCHLRMLSILSSSGGTPAEVRIALVSMERWTCLQSRSMYWYFVCFWTGSGSGLAVDQLTDAARRQPALRDFAVRCD